MDPRIGRQISSLRRFYTRFFCRDVNDPSDLLQEADYLLYKHKDRYPDWKQRLSEDPDYPVDVVARAIKDTVAGEEDACLDSFLRGAEVLIAMDRKYQPRDKLELEGVWKYDESGKQLRQVLSEPEGRPMQRLTFACGLHWEGFGELSDTLSTEQINAYAAYVGPHTEAELPAFRDDAAVQEAMEGFPDDPEFALYKLRRLTNPEWIRQNEELWKKLEKQPSWNHSVVLMIEFRRYEQYHKRFIRLGICHHPGCGKLYVKTKHAAETQLYCPRHQSYHHE